MMRTLWIVLSACCVAIVLSELLGLGALWSQGLLTARRIRDMRDLFGPQEKETVAASGAAEPNLPSVQEVLRERSMRVFSLSALETEVGLLKNMVENERTGLSAQSAEFEKQKEDFKKRLLQLSDENAVAAREQARGVLQALPPAEAVDRLMQLSVEEDVLLLREMPEATIAQLLQEFAPADAGDQQSGTAAKAPQPRAVRAKEIFERITRGEPRQSIIRNALEKIQQQETDRPSTGGTK